MATPDNTEALGVSAEPVSVFQKAETYLNKNRADSSSQSYRDIIAVYNEEAQKQGAPAWNSSFLTPMDPTAEMGFIEGIKESFTGNARETESTRTLTSYTKMPELTQILSIDAWQTAGGLMQGTPQEMAQIITAQFPDVQTRQDEKGNYILKSSQDGKEYVIKPGFGEGDLTRFGGQMAILAPATIMAGAATAAATAAGVGLLPILATGAALYGLSSAGYQLYQKSIGGEFNSLDVAMDTLAPAGIEGVVIGLKTAARNVTPVIKNIWSKATNRFRAPEEIGTMGNKTDEEIQRLFNRAKDGDIEAQAELAALGQTDLEVIAAAEALGIGQYLQPDHVSTDTQFIELMQLIKSWKGSNARAEELTNLKLLADEVVERVHAAGAQTPGDMSRTIYTQLQDTIDTLGTTADSLWTKFRATVGIEEGSLVPTAPYNPELLLNRIKTRLARNNANKRLLNQYERDFLDMFSPKEIKNAEGKVTGIEYPTIDMFESFRRQLSEGMETTPSGRYMDENSAGLRAFYGRVLEEERKAVQQNFGQDVLAGFDLARETSKLRFGAIDDQTSVFGKKASEFLGGTLDQGMKQLAKGETDKFLKFMEAIPEGDRANVLMTGLTMKFGTATKTGQLNFNTFSKWYESILAEKEAYAVLQKYLPPETLVMFNNVFKVSKGINNALQERVYNGATMQLTDLLTAESVMSGVYQLAMNAGKLGAAEVVATTTMGLPGAAIAAALIRSMGKSGNSNANAAALKAADDLLLSPSFMNMVKDQYTDESIRRFSLSSSWQGFARKVGLPPNSATDFVRSIYAATTSAVNTGETGEPIGEPVEELLLNQQPLTPPPQASVSREMLRKTLAPSTRGGISGLGEPANEVAAAPAMAPPPGAVAQGQGPSESRQMMQRLFPFDMA
jgi:hypothetical protein